MRRYLLVIESAKRRWHLQTLSAEALDKGPREEYGLLSGEALAQYLLRQDMTSLALVRGPMPFLAGNKTTVGYRSPLTGVPHYSFVGGRAAAQLFNLGLDGLWLREGHQPSAGEREPYIVVSGRAPHLHVSFKDATELPAGQRAAYYRLVQAELAGDKQSGSIFTIGTGAYLGYLSANLAADAIFHAGRGGAGSVFHRFASGLVLHGEPLSAEEFFGEDSPFARNPNAALKPLLDRYCARLSGKTGGTIVKMFATGADPQGKNTLPSWNAQRVGYEVADLGGRRILQATRHGHTGCHWCPVDCRHWHWVAADYAPEDKDIFLDDFEPAYAVFAMLGLTPASDTLEAKIELLADVNQRLILPIEQMGCDILDIGVGLAALFEGTSRGLIPPGDLPDDLAKGAALGNLEAAVRAVEMLGSGEAAMYPALRAVGDGPQALAERYPAMAGLVFTSGKGTLANAGHANALWTFLMPFSRFFGHYSGQFYKVEAALPPSGASNEAYDALFGQVVCEMLQRELFGVLCNALSNCAFTFVVYSQDGEGVHLDSDLLPRILREYGIRTTRAELEWFAEAFWAQSIVLKAACGWQPPTAADFPARVYKVLSLALNRSPEELRCLMDRLIAVWKQQAGEIIAKYGHALPW